MNGDKEQHPARARIEAQRRQLQMAIAILTCAMWSARHEVEADYDDVMAVVATMIGRVVDELDSVALYRADDAEDGSHAT